MTSSIKRLYLLVVQELDGRDAAGQRLRIKPANDSPVAGRRRACLLATEWQRTRLRYQQKTSWLQTHPCASMPS